MNMYLLWIISSTAAVFALNFELCFCACARAEYEINGECCPMCAAGDHVYWHCTVDTSTTCVPCPESTFIAEPNGLMKCFTCSVCDEGTGLRVEKACTRTADTICRPQEGFYCVDQNKHSCTLAVKHTKCRPGQYIKQKGTAFTDAVCENCTDGTYSNGSLMACQPHSKCESKGLKEIKAGTTSTDVECGKSTPVALIVGVLLMVVVMAVIIIFIKLKTQRSNKRVRYVLPLQNDLEPKTPDSVTPLYDTRAITEP